MDIDNQYPNLKDAIRTYGAKSVRREYEWRRDRDSILNALDARDARIIWNTVRAGGLSATDDH